MNDPLKAAWPPAAKFSLPSKVEVFEFSFILKKKKVFFWLETAGFTYCDAPSKGIKIAATTPAAHENAA